MLKSIIRLSLGALAIGGLLSSAYIAKNIEAGWKFANKLGSTASAMRACQYRVMGSARDFSFNTANSAKLSRSYMEQTQRCLEQQSKAFARLGATQEIMTGLEGYISEVESFHEVILTAVSGKIPSVSSTSYLKRINQKYSELSHSMRELVMESDNAEQLMTSSSYQISLAIASLAMISFFALELILGIRKKAAVQVVERKSEELSKGGVDQSLAVPHLLKAFGAAQMPYAQRLYAKSLEQFESDKAQPQVTREVSIDSVGAQKLENIIEELGQSSLFANILMELNITQAIKASFNEAACRETILKFVKKSQVIKGVKKLSITTQRDKRGQLLELMISRSGESYGVDFEGSSPVSLGDDLESRNIFIVKRERSVKAMALRISLTAGVKSALGPSL